jgi:hypothetical protein
VSDKLHSLSLFLMGETKGGKLSGESDVKIKHDFVFLLIVLNKTLD